MFLDERLHESLAVHELGIALSIHELARNAVREYGEGRLEWVRVAVGELSAVEPELLRFAWDAVVSEGCDAGAELKVEWRPAVQRCPRCGDAMPRIAGTWLRLCVVCREPLQTRGGTELDLLQVSFMSEDTGNGGQERTTNRRSAENTGS